MGARSGISNIPSETEFNAFAGRKPDDDAVHGRHHDVVQPCFKNPVLDRHSWSSPEATDVAARTYHQFVDVANDSLAVVRNGVRMSDEVHGQHEKGEAEPVVEAGLGRDNLTQRSGDISVREGALGHS